MKKKRERIKKFKQTGKYKAKILGIRVCPNCKIKFEYGDSQPKKIYCSLSCSSIIMWKKRTGTPKEEFNKRCSEPDKNGCINWLGAILTTGYGRFRVNYIYYSAHRFAFEQTYGKIPKGMCICHHCDNKKCVNPKHLFMGTQADNLRDMRLKGRRHTKVTKEQVREIRNRSTEARIKLGKEFNLHPSTINRIIGRRTWKWVK